MMQSAQELNSNSNPNPNSTPALHYILRRLTRTNLFAVLAAVSLALFVAACGGGGGGGSGGDDWDGGGPTILLLREVSPYFGASDVSVSSLITATFSEELDAETVTGGSFYVTGPSGVVAGTLGYADLQVIFTPAAPLEYGAVYTVTATAELTGRKRNPLPWPVSWSFTTAVEPDTTPPTVTGKTPAVDATGVAISSTVTATFSEALDPATVSGTSFTLSDPSGAVGGTVEYAGTTATFTPSSPLAYSTQYTATLGTGLADLAGNPLASPVTWSFTTGDAPDTTPPTVTGRNPSIDADDVSVASTVTATFSEALNPATVSGSTFILNGPAGEVAGTVSYSGTTATFSPSSPLDYSARYVATLAFGLTDLAGNELEQVSWLFFTGSEPDTTVPAVWLRNPKIDATNVSIWSTVRATFTEEMDPATVSAATFTLSGPSGEVAGWVTYSWTDATFTPSAPLAYSTQYTAMLGTGITDLAGKALAAPQSWRFTTQPAPDRTRPTVTGRNPLIDADDVSISSKVTATFSEALMSWTVNDTTFRLSGPSGYVAGEVEYSRTNATFTPSSPLAASTQYTVTLGTGITDHLLNALAMPVSWSFTTGDAPDTTPPVVSGRNPSIDATGVSTSSTITATFSEALNPLTVSDATLTLSGPAGMVAGSASYSGNIVTFTPSSPLDYSTQYTATLGTESSDLSGNTLAEPVSWSFTTGASTDSTPPTVVSISPGLGELGVALDAVVKVTFSEAFILGAWYDVSLKRQSGYFGEDVPGTVSINGNVLKFEPDDPLSSGTTYFVEVKRSIRDLARNPMAEDFKSHFSTGGSDTTAPEVSRIGSFELFTPVDAVFYVIFTEPMDPASINGSTISLSLNGVPVEGAVAYSGLTATFTPAAPLEYLSSYQLFVRQAVKDLAGNYPNFVWTGRHYNTVPPPDTAPPAVAESFPADGAEQVSSDAAIFVLLSEFADCDTVDEGSFTLSGPGGPIAGAAFCDGNFLSFLPDAALPQGVALSAGLSTAVSDLAGNHLASPYDFSFTTAVGEDVTKPQALEVAPTADAVGVDVITRVEVEFSEEVACDTLAGGGFALSVDGVPVPGRVSCQGVRAWFTPMSPLACSKLYTARISAAVTDIAGVALGAEAEWSFTTEAPSIKARRVSVPTAGGIANGNSYVPVMSGDGRYVLFQSGAGNLLPKEETSGLGIFMVDRFTGEVDLVSRDSSGAQVQDNMYASFPWHCISLSDDGKYATFHSDKNADLSAPDPEGPPFMDNVFLRNREAGTTTRVSRRGEDLRYLSASGGGVISADGSKVAFHSSTRYVGEGDGDNFTDVFIYDIATGEITPASVSSEGELGNSHSISPKLSTDGNRVLFFTDASNLVEGDTNGIEDLFAHDLTTRQTVRVNVSSGGAQTYDVDVYSFHLSGDGRYVLFGSRSSNLVENDANDASDVFLRDIDAGTTELISVGLGGGTANYQSEPLGISRDGRYVVFTSEASDIVQMPEGEDLRGPFLLIRDRFAGETRLLLSNSSFYYVAFSGDGRWLTTMDDRLEFMSGPVIGYNVFIVGPLH